MRKSAAETRARGQLVDLDDAHLLPGDEVRQSRDVPSGLRYGADFLREAVFLVRWVGADGTVDIQLGWDDNYVIVTVPLSALRRAGSLLGSDTAFGRRTLCGLAPLRVSKMNFVRSAACSSEL